MSLIIPPQVQQWLRKTPRPATILADEKKIPVPNGGRVWPDIWRTISVIKPAKLQALDADGQILRAFDLEMVADQAESGEKTADQSDLQCFAKLLSEGYDKGSKAAGPLLEMAMRFVEQQGGRLIAADKEIERLRAVNAKLLRDIAEAASLPAAPDGEGGVLGAVLQGVLAAANGGGGLAQVINGKAPANPPPRPPRSEKKTS